MGSSPRHTIALLIVAASTMLACGGDEYDPDERRAFADYPAILRWAPTEVPFPGEQVGPSIAHPDALGLVWVDADSDTVSLVHAQYGHGWATDRLEPAVRASELEAVDGIMGPDGVAFVVVRMATELRLYEWDPTPGGTSTLVGETVPLDPPLRSWPEADDNVYADALGDQVLLSFSRRETDDSGSVWMALREGDQWTIEQVFAPRTSDDPELEANWDRESRGIATRAVLLPDGRPVVAAVTVRKDPNDAYCDREENQTTLTCQNIRNSCHSWGPACEATADTGSVRSSYRLRVAPGVWVPINQTRGPFTPGDPRARHDAMRTVDGLIMFAPSGDSDPRDGAKPFSYLAPHGSRYGAWQAEHPRSLNLSVGPGAHIVGLDFNTFCPNSDRIGPCLPARAPIRSEALESPFNSAHGTYAAYPIRGPLHENDVRDSEAAYTPAARVPTRTGLTPPAGTLDAPVDTIELSLSLPFEPDRLRCAPLGHAARNQDEAYGVGFDPVVPSSGCQRSDVVSGCFSRTWRFERIEETPPMVPGTRYVCSLRGARRKDNHWPNRWDFPADAVPTTWTWTVAGDPPPRPEFVPEIRYESCYPPEAGGTVRGNFGGAAVLEADIVLRPFGGGDPLETAARLDADPRGTEYAAPVAARTGEWELTWSEPLEPSSTYLVEITATDSLTLDPVAPNPAMWFPTQGPIPTMALQSPEDPGAVPVDAPLVVQFSEDEGFVLPVLRDSDDADVAVSYAQLDGRTFRLTPVEPLAPDADYKLVIDLSEITIDTCERAIADGTTIAIHTEAS